MLVFNEDTHEYTLDGKKLISVTQLMSKHGLAPDYSNVDAEVLKKKAQRGTLIHQEIEDYLKQNELGITDEVYKFKDYITKEKVTPINSELMVNNRVVAGTIDLILMKDSQPIIADIKTTATLHLSSVSWQLSIYLYLYLNMPGKPCMTEEGKIYDLSDYDKWLGQCYHFDNEHKLEVVNIPLQPFEEVEKLIECEVKGTIYSLTLLSDAQLEDARKFATIVKKAEEELKKANETYNSLIEGIKYQMEKRGLKEFTKDGVKIECKGGKKPTTRTSTSTYVDEEQFASENPIAYDTYKKYIKTETKTTEVKGSPNKVTITILEE